jgi:lysine-specific demethylase 3
VSRFCRSELTEAIKEMDAVLAEPDIDALPAYVAIDPTLDAVIYGTDINGVTINGTGMNGAVPSNGIIPLSLNGPSVNLSSTNPPELVQINHPMLNGSAAPDVQLPIPSNLVANPGSSHDVTTLASWPFPSSSSGADIPSHTTHRFADAELTDDIFRPMWARGEPLVVTGLLSKFKIKWTPEYFIEKYGAENCLIIECRTDQNKRVTVGEFFSWFGKYQGREDCWKLKVGLTMYVYSTLSRVL